MGRRGASGCCSLTALCCCCCLFRGCWSNINITVAVMSPDNHQMYAWASPRVLPAILMAQEDSHGKHKSSLGHNIKISNYSTQDPAAGSCAESRAQVVAVDAKLYVRPDVFFGPGCVYPLASVARFASHWKSPSITAGGPAYGFDERGEEYRTIVRSGPTTTKIGDFATASHTHFNWTSRAMVIFYDVRHDDRPHYFSSEGIFSNSKQDMNVTVEAMPYDKEQDYKEMVTFMRDSGRIIYICGPSESFMSIMKTFQDEIQDPENYAIFYLDVFGESSTDRKPWQKAGFIWADAIKAFKSVFVITYHNPENPEYVDFQKRLHARASREFSVHSEPSLMDYIAGSFYDGFVSYAMALEDTLADGGKQNDGINITARTQNRQFWGVTGLVDIDDKNARNIDVDSWASTNQETGEFGVVAYFNGSAKEIIWSQTERIHWPSGGPPSDDPPCVFSTDDPSCNDGQSPVSGIVAVGSGLALIIFGISSFLIYSQSEWILIRGAAEERWRSSYPRELTVQQASQGFQTR